MHSNAQRLDPGDLSLAEILTDHGDVRKEYPDQMRRLRAIVARLGLRGRTRLR
jgi:hypothetical protein